MAKKKKKMDETVIKTRLGLILQGVLREALTQAGFSFDENHQYDPICEKPDFLIPNATKPKFVLEVHQTEARDSFRMKILRAFTAVAEAKAFYGEDIISVNILFGDPNTELPASNVKALYGFFDVNVVPRYQVNNPKAIEDLEAKSLQLASDENYDDVTSSTQYLIREQRAEIQELVPLLKQIINQDQLLNTIVNPLWELERKRTASLSSIIEIDDSTYYKRGILNSLSFTEEELAEVLLNLDPSKCTKNCSEEIKKKLIAFKIAERSNSIRNDIIIKNIDDKLIKFTQNPNSSSLISVGRERLKENQEMYWFFEDIRCAQRRLDMSKMFLEVLAQGSLEKSLFINLSEDIFNGFSHRRAWIIDCCTRALEISQNELSRRIYTSYDNPGNFGDPISHLAPKTQRLRSLSHDVLELYARNIAHAFFDFAEQKELQISNVQPSQIADRLLELRLDGSKKLQKLNPLYLVAEDLFVKLGLKFKYSEIKSIIADLAGSASAAAKFQVYKVTKDRKTILVNAIAVHDHNGDHKSKEWGARRRSTLYRLVNGQIQPSEYTDGIFVIDGEWEQKDINRLYNSGWNHIVRLSQLEIKLREVFDL